jgi:hypothetical protein
MTTCQYGRIEILIGDEYFVSGAICHKIGKYRQSSSKGRLTDIDRGNILQFQYIKGRSSKKIREY